MTLTRDISGDWFDESLIGMGSRENGRRGIGNCVCVCVGSGVCGQRKLFDFLRDKGHYSTFTCQ